MEAADSTTTGAACEPRVASTRTIRSTAGVLRSATADSSCTGERSADVRAASSRSTPAPARAGRGAGKSSSTRRPSSRIQRRSSRSAGIEPSRGRRDELAGEIEQPRLERAPRRRSAVERRRQRLSVRRFEGIPVVTAVAAAGEPMQTPGSREVPADRVDRTRVRRHDVDPHPPPQHRIESQRPGAGHRRRHQRSR